MPRVKITDWRCSVRRPPSVPLVKGIFSPSLRWSTLNSNFKGKRSKKEERKMACACAAKPKRPKPNRLQSCHTLFAAAVISCAAENNPCYYWEAAEEVALHFSSRNSLKGYDDLFSWYSSTGYETFEFWPSHCCILCVICFQASDSRANSVST